MSAPFSNTHLRVPQGFSAILEGLAREVLRDQPEDIPKYAAQYFDALLRQREDSGIDPAEWAAKHEDKFYNNHAFKASEASPENESATEVTTSKAISCESQAEDESNHSADATNLSTTQPNASQDIDSSESTDEYEDQHDLTEEDSVNKLPAADLQPDDLSGTEEETDPTITTFDHVDREDNGRDSSLAPDQEVPQSELERTDLLSFRGISNVDVCAQELKMSEDEEGDEQESVAVEEEIANSKGEENANEQPVQIFPYSGLADVDVCATELERTETAMEGATAEDDEDSSKHPPEETEGEDQVEERTEEEGAEAEMIHESLAPVEAGLDTNDIPKEEEGTETEASSGVIHGGSAPIEAGLDYHDILKEEEGAETEASSGGKRRDSAHIEANVDNNVILEEEGGEREASSGGIHKSSSHIEASLNINDIPKEGEGSETEASGVIHGSSSVKASLDNNVIPMEGEGAETEASSGGIHESSSHIEAGLDKSVVPKEEEETETEASFGGIHESSSHIEASLDNSVVPKEEEETEPDAFGHMPETSASIEASLENNPTPKEDSLVEISFDDVPEARQIKDDEEKQPEEEGLQVLEVQQEEESTELSVVATDENISSTQAHDQPDMMKVEQEVNSEGVGTESQQEASDIMKEKVDTNYSNLYDTDDDEKHEGVNTISLSHQPTTKADKENPEEETDHKNEDNEEMNEGEFHQSEDSEKEAKSNDPDFKEDETTDTVGGDEEDMPTEGYSEMDDGEIDEGGAENHSSQITHSDVSTAATEAERETLEASAQHPTEENRERQRTPVEPEDTAVEKEARLKERSSEAEELVEEGKIGWEMQEKSDATHEEGSISLSQSAHQLTADHRGEERLLGSEKESTEPEGKSGDEEDCSRPQEEEDIMDIPLDDPEANRAAAKIQAGFRGHMTRKKMKPEDKAEGEEVSSTGDVLNGSQGDTETGGSGAVERDDTSVPEQ